MSTLIVLDDVKSLFNGVTSNVGERIESATSVVGSVVGSVRASETGKLTAARCTTVLLRLMVRFSASSIFAQVTSVLGTETQSAFATIVSEYRTPLPSLLAKDADCICTAANGVPVVEVTQVSGSAITIATQSGSTTTFAGHTFTVAPPAPSSSSSSSSSSGSSSSSSASASAT